eukprot:CAMPEP_0114561006 /NCGR_PEP_ID=MMETSP0114-20121206/11771_1 /TAXON_ID=31324 /ORGANISM="Goniomonas sp, Strain m" /LENGTH=136 /DNA_ID=CAMNT_0001746607 /DNA_START=13 /DNA_END=423 /DNA_ORIENTATION=-
MSEVRKITAEELAKHNLADDCWFVINGKVYDVTKFLPDHPGGDAILVESAGGDATQAFEDIGHSDDAREQMAGLLIGDFDSKDKSGKAPKPSNPKTPASSGNNGAGSPLVFVMIALVVVGLAFYAQQSGMLGAPKH